jgi:hypothetical protein
LGGSVKSDMRLFQVLDYYSSFGAGRLNRQLPQWNLLFVRLASILASIEGVAGTGLRCSSKPVFHFHA